MDDSKPGVSHICLEDVVASNTGAKLFTKDSRYTGHYAGKTVLARDNFGCYQPINQDEKFYKKHFLKDDEV